MYIEIGHFSSGGNFGIPTGGGGQYGVSGHTFAFLNHYQSQY